MQSTIIKDYLSKIDLDIRKSGSWFTDQKVTPDVLSSVADFILIFCWWTNVEFTIKDIWHLWYSNKIVKEVFWKPDVLEQKAKWEYDKFF